MWFLFGYCVAIGDPDSHDSNAFLGVDLVALYNQRTNGPGFHNWAHFFTQGAYASTAATIVSGAMAGRIRSEAFFLYTAVCTAWIYPVVAHWIWDDHGWLSPWNPNAEIEGGVIDFAGSVFFLCERFFLFLFFFSSFFDVFLTVYRERGGPYGGGMECFCGVLVNRA